ncbi:hypothetical protein Drose_06150 [Dactylosporangium roseum]|uniref:Phage tail protein n=1 Tax=Dactylosporangium roseum TaxID=47989 RepID=A0ABY5Z725_9ACTN|nr:hypothetical protein [Dactylosporangium roseum]UWZ37854.1 hypothetical protein Drose_06150 [Dactylosporangium roseum]
MSDNRNLLAGISAAGADGTGLVWMAQPGSTAPTDATTTLAAAWKNMGGQAEAGVSIKQSISTTKKKFYGSTDIQRTLVTEQERTIDVVFGETNARTMEVFWRRALNSITPAAVTGAFGVAAGAYSRQLYALVIDMVDGVNRVRFYCPSVEVTGQGDVKIASSESLDWGVTLTAYPDTSGNAIYPFFALPNLG